jgi:hypothetical protein
LVTSIEEQEDAMIRLVESFGRKNETVGELAGEAL